MANEWYVQHGGKQYGPLTSANLKKLAADGKIMPATSVRLGSEGAWVPASRVQGLFAAAPPVAPPPPPPMANPLARMPVGRVARPPQAVAVDGGAMAARIVGAVALILGILALATCWLPLVGGPIGWTGIVAGGLGLLVAIGGLVLAAMHKGSGLYLNIAAGGSSLVGLVLAVVLGVAFNLFSSPAAPVVVQKPTLPPPIARPPVTTVAKEPEPEPEPEPQWTDASQSSIQQGDIKASIVSAKVENVRLESGDLSRLAKQKSQPMLKIVVTIENTAKDKIIEVPLWHGGGGDLPAGLGDLVGGELGKAVTSASASATLTDNFGNPYKQTPTMMLFGNTVTVGKDNAVRPGKSAAGDLVFPPPLDTIEYLRLELSPAGFGGDEPLRFQIPKAMIAGP